MKLSTIIFILNLFFFALILFHDLFLNPNYGGDESKYLGDLLKANNFGLTKPILEGTSMPYLLLSYYLNKILENPLLSLRVTSLICGVLMFLILLKLKGNLKKPLVLPIYLWLLYLFIIQTTIFSAVNDILLDFFGTMFFVLLLNNSRKINFKLISIGLCLALMLVTRKMAATYIVIILPLFFLFSFLKTQDIFNKKNFFIVTLSFIIFFLLMNFYPLVKNQNFSFDDKILKGKVTWAQWDYHNAILINQGKQDRFHHIPIAETKKYLEENGEDSLPSSFFEMIWFDPLLTLKEFFIDALTGLKYIFRQTGLLLFAFIFFFILRLKKILNGKYLSSTDFVYIFSAAYFFMISFIVVANIQGRWFMVFMPVMIILIGKDLKYFPKKERLIFCIGNNIILTMMCFPFLIKQLGRFLETIQ